jgi:beta-glucanase (GH16 family)
MRPKFYLLPALFIILINCGKESTPEPKKPMVFSIPERTLTEGSAVSEKTINIQRSGNTADRTEINYTLNEGSAKNGTDFQQTPGTIIFEAGASTATASITITGDTNLELTEYLTLSFPYDGTVKEYRIEIKDDDQPQSILSDADGFYTPESYPSMELVWSDEFNDTELNQDVWNYDLGDGCPGLCGWGNNELEYYRQDTSNIKLKNGKLVITATLEGGSYYSGRINTKNNISLTYGRIDIRAKLPKGQGIWPALWLLGSNIDQKVWPGCGEIDLMEMRGQEPDRVQGTVHYDNGGYVTNTGFYVLDQSDFTEQYHVFSLVWDQNKISWYVDNENYKNFSNSGIQGWPFNNPFYFLMNVAVGGKYLGNPDQSTPFPQVMSVDYIRVFQ